ncbi:MAG: hypothetical protein NVS3B21_33870 [Acidimicrobiales bacterium]
MATVPETKPGMWEVRVFTGRDAGRQATQLSRTVQGTKKDARRVAAELTLTPTRAVGRTVTTLLDSWVELNEAAWAPATVRDNRSRVALIKGDPIAGLSLGRLTVADVDRWHGRLRRAGAGDAAIRNRHLVLRAALSQAVRWGWVSINVASAARLMARKRSPRESMTLDDVKAVLAAGVQISPAAGLALRLVEDLCARLPQLARYRKVRLSTAGRLRASGFALVATMAHPHVDIVLPDASGATLHRLDGCFDPPIDNPGRR